MSTILLDRVISTDYGQFDLGWAEDFGFDGDFDRFFAGQLNGLVGAADRSGVYLHFARQFGGSPVRCELLDAAPGAPDAQWEDVVEVSVQVPDGATPRWSSWAGEEEGALAIPSGTYRLRVSARGRDAGHDMGVDHDDPLDRYLLELWPAPMAPDAILRVTSADARYWHAELGGRR